MPTLIVTQPQTVTPALLEVSVKEESPLFVLTVEHPWLDLHLLMIALHAPQGDSAREVLQPCVVRVTTAQQELQLKLLVQSVVTVWQAHRVQHPARLVKSQL